MSACTHTHTHTHTHILTFDIKVHFSFISAPFVGGHTLVQTLVRSLHVLYDVVSVRVGLLLQILAVLSHSNTLHS